MHCQEPKYTASSKTKRVKPRNDSTKGYVGIGWSDDGINLYYKLYDLVTTDREERGAVFNNELLNVFVDRRRKRKLKPNCPPAEQKQKVIPQDDLGSFDSSYNNVLGSSMIPEYHASMQF
jgi:hypothetical protein